MTGSNLGAGVRQRQYVFDAESSFDNMDTIENREYEIENSFWGTLQCRISTC
jgi:hypothetical protein